MMMTRKPQVYTPGPLAFTHSASITRGVTLRPARAKLTDELGALAASAQCSCCS